MRFPVAHTLVFTVAVFLAAITPAYAFPVSGTWTYDNASQPGPAQSCRGNRVMRFAGDMRYDMGTASPEYRNLSSQKVSADTWALIDQFYTGVVWGRVHYNLRVVDEDHIVIRLTQGGKLNTGGATWMLRRCG